MTPPMDQDDTRLTPEQVHDVAFDKPPIGKRGYNEDQVDAFLNRIEAALRDPTARSVSPQEIRAVTFSKPPIGRRGYNPAEVDAFLELVAAQLDSGRGATSAQRSAVGQVGAPTRRRRGLVSRLGSAATVVALLVVFGFAAYDTFVLLAGTPATAKIEHCTTGTHLHGGSNSRGGAASGFINRVVNAVAFPAEGCTGTWRVGDESRNGSIVGGDIYDYSPQSSAQVRVFGGTAYTVGSLQNSLAGVIFCAAILAAFFFAWRLSRTGRFRP